MQKIILEKNIKLDESDIEVTSLSVDESINYKIEKDGIRAVGNLLVKGVCSNQKEFEDSVDLDVLATYDKIIDQRDFSIRIDDFSYELHGNDLLVSIQAEVHGVISGEARYVKEATIDEIESLIEQNEREILEMAKENIQLEDVQTNDDGNFIEFEDVGKESVEETIELEEVTYPSKKRLFFEDSEDSVGTYYLYIVRNGDSYQSIAAHYNVDNSLLMAYNKEKDIIPGTIVIVPYCA